MTIKMIAFIVLGSILSMTMTPTYANIIPIQPSKITFNTSHRMQRVFLTNQKTHTAFIKMVFKQLACKKGKIPTGCTSLKTRRTDPNISAHLKFSPQQFIMKPGKRKAILISWQGPIVKQPAILSFHAEDFSSKATKTVINRVSSDKKNAIQIKVKMISPAELLLQPTNTPTTNLTVQRTTQNLSLHNPSKNVIKLMISNDCSTEKNCTPFTPPRLVLFPSDTFKLKLKPNEKLLVKAFSQASQWTKIKGVNVIHT